MEKEAFLILLILFYLHVEILHRGYYSVHPDIMVFTAGFCKRLHLSSSTYLRATDAWPPRIHWTISKNHRGSTSDVFHSATLILSCAMLICTVGLKWPVGTSECDSALSAGKNFNVNLEQYLLNKKCFFLPIY